LSRWRDGDASALDQLTPLVYDNLRRLASHYLASEKPGHTLSPTAVVHEAYLRLLGVNSSYNDRAHFLAMAARQMRRVLVDHARQRASGKRGGGWRRVTLTTSIPESDSELADILSIQQALERLECFDPRKVEIVDLLVFGGLTVDETAASLHISPATVDREWRMARAWLRHELRNTDGV
jgi:RNA polymerase sigma factor (TIGR02999 family)